MFYLSCGYYGFCNYAITASLKACKEKGVVIFEDVTHSMLSADGIDPLCDYFAGSFRKWMGVDCGGFAVKRNGTFETPLLPVEATHLKQRKNPSRQKTEIFSGRENFDFVRCLIALPVMIIQNISYAMLTSIPFAGQGVKTMLHF
ncbi:MAG: hypothetical protein ACLUUG_07810 [Lachnospiraceae bacterium]